VLLALFHYFSPALFYPRRSKEKFHKIFVYVTVNGN